MPELSKKIGEQGEELALTFFHRIGWSPVQTGLDIPCGQPAEHKLKGSQKERTKHGLDLLFSYICPLVPRTRRNVLISMKNSDYEKTTNKTSLVRDDLRDLDTLVDCFKISEKRAELQSQGGHDRLQDCGILIRINRDSDVTRRSVGGDADLSNRQGEGNRLYFVENERFDFVDSCMNYLDIKARDRLNRFNIYRNSLSVGGNVRVVGSSILPIQNLVGGPIVVRSERDDHQSLIIFSNEGFSEGVLKRLVGLALQCSEAWPSEIKLVFHDYDRTKQGIVDSIKSQISEKRFADTIQCDSFELRSRLR